MRCEAKVKFPSWMNRDPDQCSNSACVMAQGLALCRKHAEGRQPQIAMDDETLIAALREIAHGSSGTGARTDLAVVQTIARQALGELPL